MGMLACIAAIRYKRARKVKFTSKISARLVPYLATVILEKETVTCMHYFVALHAAARRVLNQRSGGDSHPTLQSLDECTETD